jgi:tetratricopeptide (TPR) repeat protein
MTYSAMELANVFIQTGELADALDALNQHLDNQPGDDAARRLRISVLMRLAEPAHLAQALHDSQQLEALTADDYLSRSIVLEKQGQLDEAAATMQTACSADPDNTRYTERLLQLYSRLHHYEKALTLLESQPRHWRWLERTADIHVLRGDDAAATRLYQDALQQLDTFKETMRRDYWQALRVRLLMARGHTLRRRGLLDEAAADYDAAQTLLPDDPSIAFNRGLLLALRGDTANAITVCRAALNAASDTLQQRLRASLADNPAYETLRNAL